MDKVEVCRDLKMASQRSGTLKSTALYAYDDIRKFMELFKSVEIQE